MSTCGRCKNCRWWGGSLGEDPNVLSPCELFVDGTGQYVEKNARAVTMTNLEMWTAPNFGCVHFEKREA